MENTVNLLKSGGPALGMLPKIPYLKEGIIAIAAPASLLAYTDGITELENDNDEEFGIEKLSDLFISFANSGISSKEVNDKIAETLNVYKGKKEYMDDVTLLCCRILKRSQLPLFNQG
jgi:sigma-B regulation protein RsbU (phosphoserine phosphatase)